MSFYGPEPFDGAEATYVWTGVGQPGFFSVTVHGNAPNYTSEVTLVRDTHFTGGLKIDVMGWTGPLGRGTAPYKVSERFPGAYLPQIVIDGNNKTITIPVKGVPCTASETSLEVGASAG